MGRRLKARRILIATGMHSANFPTSPASASDGAATPPLPLLSRLPEVRDQPIGVLAPAVVALFGRWNWWLPAWAARILRVEPSPMQPEETPPSVPQPVWFEPCRNKP